MKFTYCLAAAIAATVLILAGCEDNANVQSEADGSAESFRLHPASINIDTNLTPVVIQVLDGAPPFRWEMSDPTLGTLTGTNGFSRFGNYSPLTTNRAVNTIRVRDANQWRSTTLIAHGF